MLAEFLHSLSHSRYHLSFQIQLAFLYKYLYNLHMKKLRFMGSSLDDLRQFPLEARRDVGFELDALQRA